MKKSVLLLLALWACHLTLMAITVSQQRSSQMALFEAQIGVSNPVVKFTATNKPATVADLKVSLRMAILSTVSVLSVIREMRRNTMAQISQTTIVA